MIMVTAMESDDDVGRGEGREAAVTVTVQQSAIK